MPKRRPAIYRMDYPQLPAVVAASSEFSLNRLGEAASCMIRAYLAAGLKWDDLAVLIASTHSEADFALNDWWPPSLLHGRLALAALYEVDSAGEGGPAWKALAELLAPAELKDVLEVARSLSAQWTAAVDGDHWIFVADAQTAGRPHAMTG